MDPDTKNYREYVYHSAYGKDYYWENYDEGIYSERVFVARYDQLTYYTDKNDEFTDWGYQAGLAVGIAVGCCCLIGMGVAMTSCIQRRRKRKREAK